MFVNLLMLLSFFLTQIGTGPGNCGPTSTAMVLHRYGYNISVEETRNIIGYDDPENGGMRLEQIEYILSLYNIDIMYTKEIYDNSILLIDTTGLSNKKYEYNSLHYIYVLYKFDDYYLCHDPMGGPNQRYLTTELEACKLYNIRIISMLPVKQWEKEFLWAGYWQVKNSQKDNF